MAAGWGKGAAVRELRGIAETLDPHVAESLRIVEHFDALVARRVGLTTLVRAATMLTGAAVGVSDPERQLTIRIDAAALRDEDAVAPSPLPEHWQHVPLGPSSSGCAWLEREGEPHVNDLMVLERLAQAVQITIDRTFGWGDEHDEAVTLLLSPDTSGAARSRLAARLGLTPSEVLRVVATPSGSSEQRPASAPLSTTVEGRTLEIIRAGQRFGGEATGRGGVSADHSIESLPRAAEEAIIGLRFARPGEVLGFDDLGVLADAVAPSGALRDDRAYRRIRELLTKLNCPVERLEALDAHSSNREIATRLGIHHSTVSKLRERADSHLGYDTSSPFGALRFAMDLRLSRYADAASVPTT